MNFHLYLKTLRDYRKSTFWFFVGTILLGLYTTGFYPTIRDSSNMIALLEDFPEWTQSIIGDASSYATAEGFLNLEVFEIMAPLIVAVYVITKGADSIAREEERPDTTTGAQQLTDPGHVVSNLCHFPKKN